MVVMAVARMGKGINIAAWTRLAQEMKRLLELNEV
jgi:hypothetical protein